MGEKIKQRYLLLPWHAIPLGVQCISVSSLLLCSPVALAGCCWAAGGQAAAVMSQPLPLPSWTSLFPSMRDWIISVSIPQAAGVNPGLRGSAPYREGSDVFSFLLQIGQISRNFFSSVLRLHKKLLGVLEGKA